MTLRLGCFSLVVLIAEAGCASIIPVPATAPVDIETWSRTAEAVNQTCRQALDRTRTTLRALVTDSAPADPPGRRLVAIETQLAELKAQLAAERFVGRVLNDDALRQASQACSASVDDLQREMWSSPTVLATAQAARSETQDTALRTLAATYIEHGRRLGAHLDEDTRARVTAWHSELERIQTAFQNTLFNGQVTIDVPDDEMTDAPAGLRAVSTRGETGWRVPVGLQTHQTFMRTMRSSETRRRYLTAYANLGGSVNTVRVRRAVRLRRNIARTLGFSSWSDLRTSSGMAGSASRAQALIDHVRDSLLPKARAELTELAKAKSTEPFQAWDYAYFQEQSQRRRVGITGEAVRPYFPSDHVVPAMFRVFEALLNIRVTKLETAPVWAPGVSAHAVQDADTHALLGYVYLDLLPRSGKFLRPATFQIRVGRQDIDDQRRLPISAIVGSGPAPTADTPPLFSHRDLVELFHELGHVMHMTLSDVPYATLFGANVRRDFAEAPSQMLENWMWTPAVIKRLSRHIETGAALPDDAIDRLRQERRAWGGLFWTRQTFLAAFDLAMHGQDPDAKAPNAVWFELQPQYTPWRSIPGTIPAASFLPIMGGYDSTYYGYVWSRVLARDMFTAFEQAGLEDAETGLRYRRQILAPGGVVEPDRLVQDFLGRPPQPEAFLRSILAPPNSTIAP